MALDKKAAQSKKMTPDPGGNRQEALEMAMSQIEKT